MVVTLFRRFGKVVARSATAAVLTLGLVGVALLFSSAPRAPKPGLVPTM